MTMFKSRRSLLHTLIVCLTLLALSTTAITIHSESSPYQEAPMLAAQVQAGKLPSVDKRLPSNPVVVEPEEKTGKYGGTWHMAIIGDDRVFLVRSLGYEGLMRWDADWTR